MMQLVGRPSEEEVLISRTIEKALRRSRAVDTEGLCIVAGEKVSYCIYAYYRAIWSTRGSVIF
jgi:exosome complex RNA-binding protein Rrp42 (RNase PH superfamily)